MKKIILALALTVGLHAGSTISDKQLQRFIDGNYECLTVDTSKQKLTYYRSQEKIHEYAISSGKEGIGQHSGSYKTPLGLHCIKKKTGASSKIRSIFKRGINTGRIYTPGQPTCEDLILTRVIYLEGLEKGFNNGRDKKGKLVDSYSRGILIHGTNQESKIGSPASKGCIRMRNKDIINFYNNINEGTIIWIF